MRVDEIMSKNVETLPPTATLVEAARKMKDLDVGMIPICDGEKVQGVLTDRDIVINAVAHEQNPSNSSVSDFLTGHPRWVYSDSDVEQAAQIMKDEQIRRLIVVDRNKKLVGVVSLGDISTRAEEGIAGDALEDISQPSKSSPADKN
jgi:CBS domain-containing protein